MSVFRMAGDAWKQADKALGGWLPGGGTASPITKAVFPAQPFPARSKELEELTGVKARFVDVTQTPTIVSRLVPAVAEEMKNRTYANPALGQVGMFGYRGGATPNERFTEMHELGHINTKDQPYPINLGAAGRYLKGISDKTGNLPPVDIAAGFLMRRFDAPEEDRAERFAARFAGQGGYMAPQIYSDNTSDYGNNLRRKGENLIESGHERTVNPWGLSTKVQSFVGPLLAKPLQAELNRSLPAYREALRGSDATSPELLKESERLDDLARRIKALGVEVEY